MTLEEAVATCPHLPKGKVKVEETATEIVLTGIVTSYYQKSMAQEAAKPFAKGRAIRNQIQVASG